MRPRRRAALAALAAAGLVAALACGQPPPPRDGRPDVLLISIDTLRADHLHCYGYERQTSPAIDRLAARGVLFERAFSHSPKTAPSHMSLLSGLHPEAHGVGQLSGEQPRRLAPGIPTLAALLRGAGYRTVAITAGGHLVARLGFDVGVDRFVVEGWLPRAIERAEAEFERRARASDGPPLFLLLHTYAVHDPYVPPEPYRSLFVDPEYAGGIVSARERLLREVGDEWQEQHDRFWARVDPGSPADLEHLRDLYDGGIRWADDGVARLMQRLEADGRERDTLIVLLSDHGEEFLEHGRFRHDQLYDETLRVPLILVLPGERGAALAGRRETALVALVDVLPTLLDWLDVPAPDGLHGRSLLPLLSGAERPAEAVVSGQPGRPLQAYREERWKLLRSTGKSRRELYDVLADPREQRDLAASRPEVAERLERALDARLRADLERAARHPAGPAVAPDAEERARLRMLGYLE